MFEIIQIKKAFNFLGILKVRKINKDLLNRENTYRIYLIDSTKLTSKDIEEVAKEIQINYAGCDLYENLSYFDLILYH